MNDLIMIQTKVENPLQYARNFVNEHIGKIDEDIDISAIYDRWSWSSREHILKGIQFSTGSYGRKTIKRVIVSKNGDVSLGKMRNAINELTQIAKGKRKTEEESAKYYAILEEQQAKFYDEIKQCDYKRTTTDYGMEYGDFKNGNVEIEFRHFAYKNGQFSGYLKIDVAKQLTKDKMLKVLEYAKGINQIVEDAKQ